MTATRGRSGVISGQRSSTDSSSSISFFEGFVCRECPPAVRHGAAEAVSPNPVRPHQAGRADGEGGGTLGPSDGEHGSAVKKGGGDQL